MNPARWNPAVSTPPWYIGLLVAAGLIAGDVAHFLAKCIAIAAESLVKLVAIASVEVWP